MSDLDNLGSYLKYLKESKRKISSTHWVLNSTPFVVVADAQLPLYASMNFYFMSSETIREGTNLMSGGKLEKGEKLVSGNKCFKLIMQEDGNLVLKQFLPLFCPRGDGFDKSVQKQWDGVGFKIKRFSPHTQSHDCREKWNQKYFILLSLVFYS